MKLWRGENRVDDLWHNAILETDKCLERAPPGAVTCRSDLCVTRPLRCGEPDDLRERRYRAALPGCGATPKCFEAWRHIRKVCPDSSRAPGHYCLLIAIPKDRVFRSRSSGVPHLGRTSPAHGVSGHFGNVVVYQQETARPQHGKQRSGARAFVRECRNRRRRSSAIIRSNRSAAGSSSRCRTIFRSTGSHCMTISGRIRTARVSRPRSIAGGWMGDPVVPIWAPNAASSSLLAEANWRVVSRGSLNGVTIRRSRAFQVIEHAGTDVEHGDPGHSALRESQPQQRIVERERLKRFAGDSSRTPDPSRVKSRPGPITATRATCFSCRSP